MKRPAIAPFFIATALGIWAIVFSGIHPQFHDLSDAKEIIIRVFPRNEVGWPSESYRTSAKGERAIYEKRITDKNEIKSIEDALGITWDGLVPLHSYETGTTTCSITIVELNGEEERLRFSETEWGSSGRPSERIKNYIRKSMS